MHNSISDYLKDVTPDQRRELNRIRRIAKSVVPKAEEVISYGIPTLKYRDKYLIYFAAFKDHMSVFPGSALTAALQSKLGKYKLAKGTIQFTVDNPISEEIIKEIVRTRYKEINKK